MNQPTNRTIDQCPNRRVVEAEFAVCDLVRQLVDGCSDELAQVPPQACQACVEASFEPTLRDPNPVVASLAFTAAETLLAQLDPDSDAYRVVAAQRDFADTNLPRVLPTESELAEERPSGMSITLEKLRALLPHGPRFGRRIEQWAIGMTTAPRRRPAIEQTLAQMANCGLPDPHLFVDGDVQLSPRAAALPSTRRSEAAGAWHNFFLGLVELVERQPTADAFLMVQDDVHWPVAPQLMEYLSEFLWPSQTDCIVSLYTSADDAEPKEPWRPIPDRWKYGALALVFPRTVARAITGDPWMRKYGWTHPRGVAGIDCAIGNWAKRNGVEVWHPTPSLVQHSGNVSAIWDNKARAVGLRRAANWVGGTR